MALPSGFSIIAGKYQDQLNLMQGGKLMAASSNRKELEDLAAGIVKKQASKKDAEPQTFLVHVKSKHTEGGERDVRIQASSREEAVKKVKDQLSGEEARWASVFADGDQGFTPAPRSDGATRMAGRRMDGAVLSRVADAAMRLADRAAAFFDSEEERERQDAAKPGPHNSRELGYGLPSPFNPDNSKSKANPIKKREIVTVAPKNQFPMAHTTNLLQNKYGDADVATAAELMADLKAKRITLAEFGQRMNAVGTKAKKDADEAEGGGPDVDKIRATKERDTARREAQRRVIDLESRAEAMAAEEGMALREELAAAKEALSTLESPEGTVDDKTKKDADNGPLSRDTRKLELRDEKGKVVESGLTPLSAKDRQNTLWKSVKTDIYVEGSNEVFGHKRLK